MATDARVTYERLPLELTVEVIAASGTRYRWDANQRTAGDRLTGKTFSTKVGEGFSSGGGKLARRIDLDYPDLKLVNTVAFVGADRSIAYEGRLSEMPRELGDTQSIGVTLTGWMAAAKDRKFSEVYVDRDMSAWGGASSREQAAQLTANLTPYNGSGAVDPVDARQTLTLAIDGKWVSPFRPIVYMWYDIGPGTTIGRIEYSWRVPPGPLTTSDVNWDWRVRVSPDDTFAAGQGTANLRAAGPDEAQGFTPTVGLWRYGLVYLTYGATPFGADGARYSLDFYKVAVYGNHGLTLRAGEPNEPNGVYASDVISNIVARWCPQLNAGGVQDTTFVIPHLAFKDGVYPYDAFLEVNKYHLWHLAVWENRTLHYRPYDLRDYDWEVRTDDPGVTFSPQGPSTEAVFNGATVTYNDLLTGTRNVLTPDTNPELTDPDPRNPWNEHDIAHWDDIQLSSPTTKASALQLGRAILGDKNRPKAPGSLSVRGYIRDRAGSEQPGWKVRAGDTVAVTSFPNDQPRLITETQWDDESKTLTLSVDRPPGAIDAVLDRLSGALSARGLT